MYITTPTMINHQQVMVPQNEHQLIMGDEYSTATSSHHHLMPATTTTSLLGHPNNLMDSKPPMIPS